MSEQSTIEETKPFWLSGNFAPVYEELTDTELKVTGSIPAELNGRYLRNGANPQSGEQAHWFLGNGMMVIVDASNMENDAVARIHLPARVPAGFHGSWIADPA